MSGSTDLVGLLHADPALKGVLEWHLEDLRKDLTAARLLKHGTADLQQSNQAASTMDVGTRANAGGTKLSLHRRPHATHAGFAANWPYDSATVHGVASIKFDPRATLGDEESLSTSVRCRQKPELEVSC